jgi:hypothetical protein
MRHLNAKFILTTVAITGVIGAGVAVAADQSTCPYGNTPQAGQEAPDRLASVIKVGRHLTWLL